MTKFLTKRTILSSCTKLIHVRHVVYNVVKNIYILIWRSLAVIWVYRAMYFLLSCLINYHLAVASMYVLGQLIKINSCCEITLN